MARKTPGVPDRTAFNTLKRVIRRKQPLPQPLGHSLAARGFLNLALTALAYPALKAAFPLPPREKFCTWIFVWPHINGVIRFDVNTSIGESVEIDVRPEDFDTTNPVGLQEFKAYRAFVDTARRLALNTKTFKRDPPIGAFTVFCSKDDRPMWAAVWEVWKHAHRV